MRWCCIIVENDIQVWEENQKQLKSYQLLQDETVSQSTRPDTDHNVDQFKYMTNGDGKSIVPVKLGKPLGKGYDGYASMHQHECGA